jgi:hypothetical protein
VTGEARDLGRPTLLFWVISVALLLWGLAGASIYVAYFVETPEQFAQTAETSENARAYADYIAGIPYWAVAIGVIAAATRLLGAVGLLLRRAWALPLYAVSLVFFLAALYRGFFLADAADAMSAPHVAVEALFVALGVFAIWFAHRRKAKGVLR